MTLFLYPTTRSGSSLNDILKQMNARKWSMAGPSWVSNRWIIAVRISVSSLSINQHFCLSSVISLALYNFGRVLRWPASKTHSIFASAHAEHVSPRSPSQSCKPWLRHSRHAFWSLRPRALTCILAVFSSIFGNCSAVPTSRSGTISLS